MLPPMLVIYSWPLISLILFKKMRLPLALCWSLIAGYLLLPFGPRLDLPLLPQFDKNSIPVLAAVLFVLMKVSQNAVNPLIAPVEPPMVLKGWLPRHPIGLLLFFCMITSAALTVMTNGDSLRYGSLVIPGLKTFDAFSVILNMLMTLLPLLLARKCLATDASHRDLLLVLAASGFAYSFLALYEVRMSPQLNNIFYGYFPSSWRQHLRGGGFRPIVFLKHGLFLGVFLTCSMMAAVAYMRILEPKQKAPFWAVIVWITLALVMAKTFTAFIIAIFLAPVVLLLAPRVQVMVAAVVALTVLFYPLVRGAGLIPTQAIVSQIAVIDAGRASSLQFRLNNEDILLAKANERPLFGWGGWGRFRVYDENGKDISTTDGRWIISIGGEGWFGYLSRFGLLTVPIVLMMLRRKKYEISTATSSLCLILAANLVDLIPNAGLTNVTWLIAGALLGRLETEAVQMSETASPVPIEPDRRTGTQYSRPRPQKQRWPSSDGTRTDQPGYTRRTAQHSET